MNKITDPFEYVGDGDVSTKSIDFVITIPQGLTSKEELLETYAVAGKFPPYFGENWDALLDCLHDFSWIEIQSIVIQHGDLPLKDSPSDCETYLDILKVAANDWLVATDHSRLDSPVNWPTVDHTLRILFPADAKSLITRMVGSTPHQYD